MKAQETVRLAIGSLENALDLLGNVYNDVRDALNEFVANAYDEIVLGRIPNGRVQVKLMPKARPCRIIISDNGRGISQNDLRRIATNIAKSSKPGSKTPSMQVIGEKGIGILGFQALADKCQIISRHEDSKETLCLELVKGSGVAHIRELDRGNLLEIPGTEVHLIGVDERTFRVLTLPKLVEYFRDRWRRPLAEDAFKLFVVHGRRSEIVQPGRYEGELAMFRVRTEEGYVEFELYLTPRSQTPRAVAILGTGGVQIVHDLGLTPEFEHHPWTSGQVQGEIRFSALRQTTGRRGLQRDRRVFPCLLEAARSIEAELSRRLEKLNAEHDSQVDRRLAKAVRQAFGKALSEIEALSTLGLKAKISDPGGAEAKGALFDEVAAGVETLPSRDLGEPPTGGSENGGPPGQDEDPPPRRDSADEAPDRPEPGDRPPVDENAGRTRQSAATGLNYRPIAFPDSNLRSRYNEALRTIEINSAHSDYRRVRTHDRRAFLDYLVLLIAKELALLNYRGIDEAELLEKYAELVARVQFHLPKRI